MIVQTAKTHSFQRGRRDSKAALSDKERYGKISFFRMESARQICAGFPQGNSQTEEVSGKGKRTERKLEKGKAALPCTSEHITLQTRKIRKEFSVDMRRRNRGLRGEGCCKVVFTQYS